MTSIAGVDRLFEAHRIVADLEASIAFYRDRLGLDLAHVVPASWRNATAALHTTHRNTFIACGYL